MNDYKSPEQLFNRLCRYRQNDNGGSFTAYAYAVARHYSHLPHYGCTVPEPKITVHIMFTIPLAFTGGFLALLITGFDISVVSLVGFVMLCGIIVNNGIVLVDYINKLRIDGKERIESIVEAGKTRMRPILITALTTVLGLVVMALGIGTGAEMMQPIAIVCIGGLLYATFMTLYIVPVIYDLFNKKELKKVSDEDLEFIDE